MYQKEITNNKPFEVLKKNAIACIKVSLKNYIFV